MSSTESTARQSLSVPDHQSLPVIVEDDKKRTRRKKKEDEEAEKEEEEENTKKEEEEKRRLSSRQWVQGSVINPEGFKIEGKLVSFVHRATRLFMSFSPPAVGKLRRNYSFRTFSVASFLCCMHAVLRRNIV